MIQHFHLNIFLAGIECFVDAKGDAEVSSRQALSWPQWSSRQALVPVTSLELPPGPQHSDLTLLAAQVAPGDLRAVLRNLGINGHHQMFRVSSASDLSQSRSSLGVGEPGDGVSVDDARFDSQGHRVSFILITSSPPSSSSVDSSSSSNG